MDRAEVRLRALEMASRVHSSPTDVLATAEKFEAYVMEAAETAGAPADAGSAEKAPKSKSRKAGAPADAGSATEG